MTRWVGEFARGKASLDQESERWLKDIFDYIAQDSPIAAESVVSGIYEKPQQLIQFPESGYRYEGSTRDVRILLYGHYRIAYIVADDQIIVLGVFHGALAIDRYLI